MRSFIAGCLIVLAAVPLDARAGCRKRCFVKRAVKREVVQQVVNNYYYPVERAAVYAAPPPVQVQAAALQPIYQAVQQQAAVCCIPCCVTSSAGAVPSAPLPGQPDGGNSSTPPAAGPGQEEVQTIVTRTCVSCHGDTNPKAGLSLVNISLLTSEQRMKSSLMVMRGLMPKGKPEAVSDAEAQKLVDWALGK